MLKHRVILCLRDNGTNYRVRLSPRHDQGKNNDLCKMGQFIIKIRDTKKLKNFYYNFKKNFLKQKNFKKKFYKVVICTKSNLEGYSMRDFYKQSVFISNSFFSSF